MKVYVKRNAPRYLSLLSSECMNLQPLKTAIIGTGLTMASEAGSYIFPAENIDERLFIGPGVIDPDYRGEVKLIVTNVSLEPVTIEKLQHLAELVFVKAITKYDDPKSKVFASTNLIPRRCSDAAVGYDVHSSTDMVLKNGKFYTISTGVTVQNYQNMYPVLFPRSSLLAKGLISIG